MPNGRAWLREIRFAAAIQKLELNDADGLQVEGLHLSPASVCSLEALDPTGVTPTWRAAFLATPGAPGGLVDRLGPEVTTTRFEGYNLLFKDAHLAKTPTKVFAEATSWLAAFAGKPPPRRPLAPMPEAQIDGPGWIERPVCFGDGLRGVLCAPRGRPSTRAVLIGNTAADPRAGVGNFASRLSRVLASTGVAALRFDFHGMGESPGDLGEALNIYAASRVGEFLAAAEVLNALDYSDLTLIGVCTGGYQAVRTVLGSSAFRRAVAFNAWLVMRPERSLAMRSKVADPKRRLSTDPDASRWSKIVSGEIDLAGWLARFARSFWTSLWPDARCRQARRDIRRAGRAGAELHVILGRGDLALRGLESEFWPNCSWLRRQRGVSVKVLTGLDHALFSTKSQDRAVREVFRILDLEAPRGASGPPADVPAPGPAGVRVAANG
jgi:hypothetical protein